MAVSPRKRARRTDFDSDDSDSEVEASLPPSFDSTTITTLLSSRHGRRKLCDDFLRWVHCHFESHAPLDRPITADSVRVQLWLDRLPMHARQWCQHQIHSLRSQAQSHGSSADRQGSFFAIFATFVADYSPTAPLIPQQEPQPQQNLAPAQPTSNTQQQQPQSQHTQSSTSPQSRPVSSSSTSSASTHPLLTPPALNPASSDHVLLDAATLAVVAKAAAEATASGMSKYLAIQHSSSGVQTEQRLSSNMSSLTRHNTSTPALATSQSSSSPSAPQAATSGTAPPNLAASLSSSGRQAAHHVGDRANHGDRQSQDRQTAADASRDSSILDRSQHHSQDSSASPGQARLALTSTRHFESIFNLSPDQSHDCADELSLEHCQAVNDLDDIPRANSEASENRALTPGSRSDDDDHVGGSDAGESLDYDPFDDPINPIGDSDTLPPPLDTSDNAHLDDSTGSRLGRNSNNNDGCGGAIRRRRDHRTESPARTDPSDSVDTSKGRTRPLKAVKNNYRQKMQAKAQARGPNGQFGKAPPHQDPPSNDAQGSTLPPPPLP